MDTSQITLTTNESGNKRFRKIQMTIQAIVKVGATDAIIGFFRSANVSFNVKNNFMTNKNIIKLPNKQNKVPIILNPSENNKFPNETAPNINPQIGIGIVFKKPLILSLINHPFYTVKKS